MARLNDFLARWLLRRLKRPADEGAMAALAAHVESQAKTIERQRETSGKRTSIHRKLKERHRHLKDELKALKAQARSSKRSAWRWKTECRLLRENIKAQELALNEKLETPGVAPPPFEHNDRAWRRFFVLRHTVWKHPMRLGVLRQHEPAPLVPERFPTAAPPGPEENWPCISIVTPSFNQAAFLERTMRSVLDQQYPRIEYRVCDGGSADGSVEVIRRHEGRLTGWCSERDTGPAEAINKGFSQSTGDIMAWLNSDDVLLPGAMRFVASYLARHPEVDVVYGHRVVIDERDWAVGRWVLPPHDGKMLLWGDYIPQETLFWRRTAWEKVGARLDESFSFAFDWDLLLRFQKSGARIVRLPWFLGCFRVHDAQKSSAEMSTTGLAEMARLRERELKGVFTEYRLARRVVLFQSKAVLYDRLLRWGLRW